MSPPPRLPVFSEWRAFADSVIVGKVANVTLYANRKTDPGVVAYRVVQRGRSDWVATALKWNEGVARYDCLGFESTNTEVVRWLRMIGVPALRCALKYIPAVPPAPPLPKES